MNHLPPQGESVPSKSIFAGCVDGAWICAARSSSRLELELLFVGMAEATLASPLLARLGLHEIKKVRMKIPTQAQQIIK